MTRIEKAKANIESALADLVSLASSESTPENLAKIQETAAFLKKNTGMLKAAEKPKVSIEKHADTIWGIDVKRFYWPGKLISHCPICGAKKEIDGSDHYLSYPKTNKVDTLRFMCEGSDPDYDHYVEWAAYVVLKIDVDLATDEQIAESGLVKPDDPPYTLYRDDSEG